MERKYGSNEEALNVAKEAIYLAWQACGGTAGMGFMQDRGEQGKDAVWDQAYNQKDYPVRNGSPESVSADYVFGRMMKLRFAVKDGIIKHDDQAPRSDYQAWCRRYSSYAALFDAAETEVLKQAA